MLCACFRSSSRVTPTGLGYTRDSHLRPAIKRSSIDEFRQQQRGEGPPPPATHAQQGREREQQGQSSESGRESGESGERRSSESGRRISFSAADETLGHVGVGLGRDGSFSVTVSVSDGSSFQLQGCRGEMRVRELHARIAKLCSLPSGAVRCAALAPLASHPLFACAHSAPLTRRLVAASKPLLDGNAQIASAGVTAEAAEVQAITSGAGGFVVSRQHSNQFLGSHPPRIRAYNVSDASGSVVEVLGGAPTRPAPQLEQEPAHGSCEATE